jgi:hypothetical protein
MPFVRLLYLIDYQAFPLNSFSIIAILVYCFAIAVANAAAVDHKMKNGKADNEENNSFSYV